MALLLCIVLSVLMMQAGSLYLLDYIPDNQAAIQKIYQNKMFWRHEVDTAAHMAPADGEAVMDALRDHYFRTDDPMFVWLSKKNDKTYSQALQALLDAQADYESASQRQLPLEQRLQLARLVVLTYEPVASALKSDVEVKQSVISLLQLLAMVLILCGVGAIALNARRVLVDRVGQMLAVAKRELPEGPEAGMDEFTRLEQVMYEISTRLEGLRAESEWMHESSGERIRALIRAQDYLFRFAELVNSTSLSEMSLRKLLYGLEKALNAGNAVLVLADNDTFAPAGRVLYSHHWPSTSQDELLGMLADSGVATSFLAATAEGVKVRCLAVAIASPGCSVGVLKVEAEESRVFEESEIRLLEITAQLLSLVMGTQGREQEGRRVALLEERSAIARELHDSLAQSLSYMKIQIARLQSGMGNGNATETVIGPIVDELREGLDNAYRELRELLATFRVHMDVRGLGFSIQSAIDEFSQRSSLSITLDNRLVNCRLSVNEEFHILHVVREALSNIVRHAGAQNVAITMVYQTNGTVMITIDDDGVGYTFKTEEPNHYGQMIMKERASSLGGEVEVLRRRKGGTRVRLVFTPKLAQ